MRRVHLEAIQITDFRSVGGTISLPLNAPVVLIHGTNGAGKSTVLSAIELALTGAVSSVKDADRPHLIHEGANEAHISLKTSASGRRLRVADGEVVGEPLLEAPDRRFFLERCYLQQRLLGRLLEIYEKSDGRAESHLTRFVRELLGLDELDALLDGTLAVTHKNRFRTFLPEYVALEAHRDRAREELQALADRMDAARHAEHTARARLAEVLDELGAPLPTDGDHDALAAWLATSDDGEDLVEMTRQRAELIAARRRLKATDAEADGARLVELRRQAADTRAAVAAWRESDGTALAAVLAELRPRFPTLPDGAAETPATACTIALEQVEVTLARLVTVVDADQRARDTVAAVDAELAAATERLATIDARLRTPESMGATLELAQALAALMPHLDGDDCPVCGRPFHEASDTPLIDHLAARVSALGEQAEHLQALTRARVEALGDVQRLQARREEAITPLLDDERRARTEREVTELRNARQRLITLRSSADRGTELIRAMTEAEHAAASAEEGSRTLADVVDLADATAAALGYDTTADPAVTLTALANALETRMTALQAAQRSRLLARQHLDELRRRMDEHQDLRKAHEHAQGSLAAADEAIRLVDGRRERLWRGLVADAERARTRIVREVFNDALNRVWRDLFVRLAPEERFVPKFRIPDTGRHRVVAQLVTENRDGEEAGSPGAMLSAGNLNTAALTLFLALHLSVEARLPWLLLDDPVQSMDEVHIQQFAALLRTLSKRHDRRVIIAVHERALFDYLSLELSPAEPDDRLITIELARSYDGATVARPSPLGYVEDRALAPWPSL